MNKSVVHLLRYDDLSQIDHFGGGQKYVIMIAEAMARTGWEVELIVLTQKSGSVLNMHFQRLKDVGVKLLLLQFDDFSYSAMIQKLIPIMNERKNAVIHHSDGGFVGLVAAVITGNTKTHITLHNTLPRSFHADNIVLRKTVDPFISNYFCVSKSVQKYLMEHCGVGAQKTVHIPNGVNLAKKFDSRNFEREKATIGYLGRLSGEKNLLQLLKLAKENSNVQFILTGEGAESEKLTKFISENSLSNVELTGYESDLDKFFNRIDIFCLPSETEACPLVLVEAVSYHKPILGSRVDGIAEMLGDYDNNKLFEPKDLNDFQHALDDVLENYHSFKQASRDIADSFLSKYSFDTMLSKTVRKYEENDIIISTGLEAYMNLLAFEKLIFRRKFQSLESHYRNMKIVEFLKMKIKRAIGKA